MRAHLILLLCMLILGACSKPKSTVHKSIPVTKLEKAGQAVYMSDDDTPLTVSRAGLTFAFDPDFPEHLKPACLRAIAIANEAVGIDVLDTSETPAPFSAESDGFNVISFGKNSEPIDPVHAAETRIAFTGNHIIEADIDFAAKEFTADNDSNKIDMETICLHEIGHALGLGHSEDQTSVMAKVLRVGMKRNAFTAEDIRNLRRAAAIGQSTAAGQIVVK